jgi:uncharacterized protein YjiS (DUF1127 family)
MLWRAVLARIRRNTRERANRRKLHALPDYLLADIGIRREDIESAGTGGGSWFERR